MNAPVGNFWSTQYDAEFQRCVSKRLPYGYDWLRIKAQGCEESGLNTQAVSPKGAIGVMQWMPADWLEWRDKCGYGSQITPQMAAPNIDCACAYMNYLIGQWRAPRPDFDRWRLALASYNTGIGNVLDAQKLAGGVSDYASIIPRLVDVTGDSNANQTTEYVDRITRIYATLILPEAA
jgi:soluble lytic murein transglycosylase-like protein